MQCTIFDRILELNVKWKVFKPNLLISRNNAKMINLKNEIIVWGGTQHQGQNNVRKNECGELYKLVFKKDSSYPEIQIPEIKSKTNINDYPNPRIYHSLCFWEKQNSIVLILGLDVGGGVVQNDNIFVFDIQCNTWRLYKTTGNYNHLLGGQECLIIDDFLYVFCVRDRKSNILQIQYLDLRNFNWVQLKIDDCDINQPQGRNFLCSYQVDEENILIFGGINHVGYLNDLWKFNLKQKKWVEIKNEFAPTPKQHFGFARYNQFLLTFGGSDQKNDLSFNQLWALNLMTLRWQVIKTLTQKMPFFSNHCIGINQNVLYIFGGLLVKDEIQSENDRIYMLELPPDLTQQYSLQNIAAQNIKSKQENYHFQGQYQRKSQGNNDFIDPSILSEIFQMNNQILMEYHQWSNFQHIDPLNSLKILQDIQQKNKNITYLYMNLGNSFFTINNNLEAIRYFKIFIKMYEEKKCQNSFCYRMAHYQIGVAYHLLLQLQEADFYIQKAYELDQEDPTFICGRGYHYFLLKKYEEAEICFQSVINSKSSNLDLLIEQQTAYSILSRICQIKKKFKLQIYYIEQIINIDPRRLGYFIQRFEQIILDDYLDNKSIFHPETQLCFDDKIQLVKEIELSDIFYDFALHLLQILTFFELDQENKEKSFEYFNRLFCWQEQRNANISENDLEQSDQTNPIDRISKQPSSSQQFRDEINLNMIENILTEDEIKGNGYIGDKQKAIKNKFQKKWKHRNMEQYVNNINIQSGRYEGYITEFESYNKRYVVSFDKNLQLDDKLRAKFISASEKGFITKKKYSGIKKIKKNNNNDQIQYKIKIAKSDYRLWCQKEGIDQDVHILNFDELLRHQKQKNRYQN